MDCGNDLCLDDSVLKDLVSKAVDFSLAHGICIKSKDDQFGHIGLLPFTLLPSKFPRQLFLNVQKIQTEINLVYHKIANDHEFLSSALESTVKSDDFIGRLFDIYTRVRAEGKSQRYHLGIIRTDYLLHQRNSNDCEIKQVETNTIATSFAVMASKITALHRYMKRHLPEDFITGEIIENNACEETARGMYKAWQLYDNPSAVIIFLVEVTNTNILDQRGLEYELLKLNPSIKIFYATLADIFNKASLNADNSLIYDGFEVSLVYLRTGYHSKFFNSEDDWSASFLIERSNAIKCPTVQYHLAGCKKVQQILCQPGVLEKYVSNATTIAELRKTFAAMYSLETTEKGTAAASLGINNPRNYVLKPQREGGGNNSYDEDVRNDLIKMANSPERSSYILMERMFPLSTTNYLIRRQNPVTKGRIVSELGIYGVIIGKEDLIVENKVTGHILRSKDSTVNEGGIAVGCAFLDSPCLV